MASNLKLKQRSRNILRRVSGICSGMTDSSLDNLLARCNGSVKLALVVAEKGVTVDQGRQRLETARGLLARALEIPEQNGSTTPAEPRSRQELPVLCVDGGGSKSAALVGLTSRGLIGKGNAGPGNLYACPSFVCAKESNHCIRSDGHFASTVNSIVCAAREALQNIDDNNSNNSTTNGNASAREAYSYGRAGPSFGSAWIACAGMDRTGMRERVVKDLLPRLGLDEQTPVRITNDVDLLAAAMSRHPKTSSSIVVIAGTGSIAIRYTQESNSSLQAPRRVARSGGWGHLLGDEGAGFTIGRQAVRQALSSVEDLNLGLRSTLSALERRIMAFYGNKQDGSNHVDLLSSVLSGGGDATTASTKTRIASITQIVLETAASGDQEAVDIIIDQMTHLIDGTLCRLLDRRSKGYVDPSQCGLILSGGVMLHPAYQSIFQRSLSERGIFFSYTELVPDATLAGVEYLLRANRAGNHSSSSIG